MHSVRAGRPVTVLNQPRRPRAARRAGELPEGGYPLRERGNVAHVTCAYGDVPGRVAGRVKASSDLVEMAHEYEEFRVYVVEVCQGCGWHHTAVSYVLGTGPSG